MKKFETIPPVEKKSKYYQISVSTEAADTWLRYFRLLKLADAGDEQARKECERMDNAQLVREVETDD